MQRKFFYVLIIVFNVIIINFQLKAQELKKGDFYSQASQDRFVYSVLYSLEKKQDKGFYLDIGAADPVGTNNSFFFEKKMNWEGVSIEILSRYAKKWKAVRKNPLIIEDATKVNYSKVLSNFPKIIDYLSLDIDQLYDVVLEKVLSTGHIFKIITIEHDFYRYGDLFRAKEREILKKAGYYLVCPDVISNRDRIFEDWWIHPACFSKKGLAVLKSTDLKAKSNNEIIQIIQDLITAVQ